MFGVVNSIIKGMDEKKGFRITRDAILLPLSILVIVAAVAGVVYFIFVEPYMSRAAAREAMAAHDYDKAIAIYQEMDEENLAMEARYEQAEYLFSQGQYEKAREIYQEVSYYENALVRITECTYQLGKEALENKDYASAVEEFSSIAELNYEDSADLLKESYYDLATEEYEKNNYSYAVEYFDLAGDYENAKDMASLARYSYVKDHYDRKDETTFSYLKTLKELNYEETAAMYEELYAWHAVINASSDADSTTDQTFFNGTAYLQIILYGGEPEEEADMSLRVVGEDGTQYVEYKWPETLAHDSSVKYPVTLDGAGEVTVIISVNGKDCGSRILYFLESNDTGE